MLKKILAAPTAMFFLMLVAAPVHAQAWPSKPLRFIVPFPSGGATDVLTRTIAPKLSEGLGQQVVVDNRPGAGGMIGVDLVAKSPPDGYSLVLSTVGPVSINPSLYAKMPFDPVKDLAPITLAGIARLNTEIVKVLALPDVKKRLLDSGIDAVSNTPQQFAAYIREETAKWASVIKSANVKVD